MARINYYRPYKNQYEAFLHFKGRMVKKPGRKKDYHQLRLSLKRIKAYLKLVEFISKGSIQSKNIYNQFKPVFKSAGKVREGQINLKKLSDYKLGASAYSKYTAFIRSSEKSHLKKLSVGIRLFDEVKAAQVNLQIKKILNGQRKKKFVTDCLKFLREKFVLIYKLKNVAGPHQLIHQIRIQLKSAGAVASILNEIDPKSIDQKFIKQIKKVESLIGDWHDLFVLKASIVTFIDEAKLTDRQQKKFFQVLSQIEKDSYNMLIDLDAPLAKVLSQAEKRFL